MINKKGNVAAVIIVVFVLLIALVGGVIISFSGVFVKNTMDIIYPALSDLGSVGDANLTQAASYTLTPLNSFVGSLSWVTGIAYILVLIICIGFAYGYRFTGNKWLLSFFVLCLVLIVLASIFISNIYEDFYTGTDDVAITLQSQTMISWLILYSPIVMCIIATICGIIMFTGDGEERGESA